MTASYGSSSPESAATGARRPRVFVTRRLPGDALDRLAQYAQVDLWLGDGPPSSKQLVEHAAHAAGIICLLTDRIDAAVLDPAPGLRVISNVAVGYDNIDVAAAAARGIAVGNTPGVLTETTADLTFGLMLAVARRIAEADRFVRDGHWQTWDPNLLLGYDVHGATLGIVGFGKIGQAVARRAHGFGMRVLYANSTQTPAPAAGCDLAPLDELLRASDFISIHVPLTPRTGLMIGDREFRLMKRSAVIVNTARGGVIDHEALLRALHEGRIAGAGLDVTAVEPLPPGDPLFDAPNVVLLPHIGSASYETRARMASMAVDNCIAGLQGLALPHPVPAAG